MTSRSSDSERSGTEESWTTCASASAWTTNLERTHRTANLSRAHRTANGPRTGTVWIDAHAYADVSAGAVKRSGPGREHGIKTLDARTGTKTVLVHL
ncbi:aldehyde dehydrogenase family protein [Streptomyces sp. NPDC005566]|uniref:aldehyde dehydrogenase family protein n=1 Tax=Streptomyces sp. NPDC005566 TaxID=3156886 RepID=UPI0033A92101